MNIVILGSLKNAPYNVTVPKSILIHDEEFNCSRVNINNSSYILNPSHAQVADIAFEKNKPKIDEADIIIVLGEIGEHTQRDIDYANSKNKRVKKIASENRFFPPVAFREVGSKEETT